MKLMIALLFASTAGLSGFDLPLQAGGCTPDAACSGGSAVGVVLETDVQSSKICHLAVLSDAYTVADRGTCTALSARQEFTGSFRYWHEAETRMLYVYDDAQNLVCRIQNAEAVIVMDAAP
jgi:hypothetical protein